MLAWWRCCGAWCRACESSVLRVALGCPAAPRATEAGGVACLHNHGAHPSSEQRVRHGVPRPSPHRRPATTVLLPTHTHHAPCRPWRAEIAASGIPCGVPRDGSTFFQASKSSNCRLSAACAPRQRNQRHSQVRSTHRDATRSHVPCRTPPGHRGSVEAASSATAGAVAQAQPAPHTGHPTASHAPVSTWMTPYWGVPQPRLRLLRVKCAETSSLPRAGPHAALVTAVSLEQRATLN